MMKNSILLIICVAFLLSNPIYGQAKKKNKKTETPTEQVWSLKTFMDSVNYVFGMSIQKNFEENIELNPEAFIKGFTDAQNRADTLLTQEQIETIQRRFEKQMQEEQQAKQVQRIMQIKKASTAFLEANKTKEGVKITESGLQYLVIKEGEGDTPSVNDQVVAHYEGSLIDGTVFDSSYDREPIQFRPSQVIRGWQEGIQLMKPGAIYQFFIPSELGYGDRDQGPIPGGSVLIFKVELVSVIKETE